MPTFRSVGAWRRVAQLLPIPSTAQIPAGSYSRSLLHLLLPARFHLSPKSGIILTILLTFLFWYVIPTQSPARTNTSCIKHAFLPLETGLYQVPDLSIDNTKPLEATYVALKPTKLSPTALSIQHQDTFPSLPCLEAHIARGQFNASCWARPHRLNKPLDVVWAWVNGSDHLFQAAHTSIWEETSSRLLKKSPTHKLGLLREFDELRFSIRSFLENFRSSLADGSTFHIVASDFAFPGCQTTPQPYSQNQSEESKLEGAQTGQWRLGQIPQWLEALRPNSSTLPSWKDGSVSLKLTHHQDIFGQVYRGLTFNSLAIESRLAYLQGVRDNFIYMNDDIFLADRLTSGDFWNPILGPIFRMQSNLLVEENKPRVGEWGSLHYTNDLLNKRFGERRRPYLTHTAKSLNIPILRELASIWTPELDTTANDHIFRGDADSPDVSTTFLATHYQVERWREALLWSWIVARIGGNDPEMWSTNHSNRAWRDLGGLPTAEEIVTVKSARKTLTLDGLLNPEAGDLPEATKYIFSSLDGYPYTGLGRGFRDFPNPVDPHSMAGHVASRCTINKDRCFNPRWRSAPEVFKNVAFRNTACGDCIISTLVNMEGSSGLSAFLPPPLLVVHDDERSNTASLAPILPLTTTWENASFSLGDVMAATKVGSPRELVLKTLYRYKFVIGNTPTLFAKIESGNHARVTFEHIDRQLSEKERPALLCINDDVRMNDTLVAEMFKDWMQKHWPNAAQWEATGT